MGSSPLASAELSCAAPQLLSSSVQLPATMRLLPGLLLLVPGVHMGLDILGRLNVLLPTHHHHHHYHPGQNQRQYRPPRQVTTTPGPVFNLDQKTNFDLAPSGYILTLLLLGGLGAATFGFLAFASTTSNRRDLAVGGDILGQTQLILDSLGRESGENIPEEIENEIKKARKERRDRKQRKERRVSKTTSDSEPNESVSNRRR